MSDRDTSAGPRFDPRFPPAFQPGYDERVHREEPPRVPLREAPRTDLDDLIAAAAADAHEERIASDPAFDHGDETPDAAEPAPAGPWWKRINPYLVALGLIGVALLVAAWNLAAYSARGAFFGQPSSQFDPVQMFFLQSAIFTVPLFGTLGLATLISIVVILATRWRR
ncbi:MULTISPECIES: hypothetical protein [unclassified Cryobacterium]|uniref:hypothetical protein n=1 Tax=unclassified Cryobacterium TaxID=2649013 RepID=UPI0014455C5F|nr:MULTISPECIES: hypothetical protein [unclassified Cryobacterium]